MTQNLLEVENLSVDFQTWSGTVHAVRSVSLAVAAGECLAVVGESGSGKSVTARSLVGLAGPGAQVAAGTMTFEGKSLLKLTEREWRQLRGGRIGFVLQDALTSLDPLRRVGAEVAEPLQVHGRASRAQRDSQVLSLLSDVGIPEPPLRARQYPHELSGGLRQRALIASAIAAAPSLIIADEPTTALDVTVQAQILDLLAAKKDAGTAVLLISHDLGVVARMADQIAVMYGGLIVEQGPADSILNAPAHPYTAHLLRAAPAADHDAVIEPAAAISVAAGDGTGCPYAARCPLADDRCRDQLPSLDVRDPAGQVRCWHPGQEAASAHHVERQARPAPGQVIIEADRISKRFRSPDRSWRWAVRDVSFELRASEALGIVGESGSGKSTTAQVVLGMLQPDAGTVRLNGADWSHARERDRRPRRQRIQVVYQDPLSSFDPRFTVERIIGEALGQPGARGTAAARPRITELLARVGLDQTFLNRRPPALSGGQRQRVAIARALAPEPEVIVCDEPVSALDVSIQAQILDLFTRLRTDLGVALLFISHDLGVIRQVCDRVLVMKDGTVVEYGEVSAVFSTPRHPYTQALLATLRHAEPRSAVTASEEAS
jgi:peptide/nickel transport system ATP-binding protein